MPSPPLPCKSVNPWDCSEKVWEVRLGLWFRRCRTDISRKIPFWKRFRGSSQPTLSSLEVFSFFCPTEFVRFPGRTGPPHASMPLIPEGSWRGSGTSAVNSPRGRTSCGGTRGGCCTTPLGTARVPGSFFLITIRSHCSDSMWLDISTITNG